MARALDLVFMGSAEFGRSALKALLNAGHRITAVYAQPPKPAGRGQHEHPCPIHAAARDLGIPVRTPKSLRDGAEQESFARLKADAAVVAAYGLILPRPVLEAPRLGCLNIHASALPRWRGAAPIQRAILAGDAETGVTIMQMDEGLDTGAILLMEKIPIGPTTTAGELHDALGDLGARLIVRALEGVAAGTLAATPQPKDGVTYAAKLSRDEGRLDWRKPASELARAVRAFDPWPGTWFEKDGERIKVLAVEVVEGHGAPGTVLDNAPTIACGAGALRLVTLQRAGRAAMTAGEFLRGFPLPPGTVLS
ncbi:MAG: methionyl-tRNA formyltransferase [Alphaproteobacteria bacterium]|nr:methionyl-tRNA formyltransferase [Alphaproteobacteria bacterium]MBM3949929.1 methionyl-tRNA formyltransferase [Rhodospirillales bacterium]